MSESTTRSNLVNIMHELDAVPIEMRMRAGTPDVNYLYGWIEVKYKFKWTKNCDTHPVSFDHPLTRTQGLWLARRARAGGITLVCAQVAQEWFFFSGLTAKDYFGKLTRPQMIEKAIYYAPNGLRKEKERFIEWIKNLKSV